MLRPLVLASLLLASPALAGYDLAPGSPGPQFSASGLDLVLTDAPVIGPAGPLFLDLRVVFDHADGAGNVSYAPANSLYQLYVLDRPLPAPPAAVALEGLFLGTPEAAALGGGRYEFSADLLVTSGTPDVFDTPARLRFTFDAPAGRLEEGSLEVGGPVPEPRSLALALVGMVLAAARRLA